MLNRIKYILIVAIISASLVKPALAAYDSTISYVNINDKVYEDIELVVSDGAQILVPFKQLANLFEITYSANRIDRVINFVTFDGKNGVINTHGVFINEVNIQKNKPVFIQQGIMEQVMNEAFIDASSAEKIFGIKLETDYSNITISVKIDRDLSILHVGDKIVVDRNAPKAYSDAIVPTKLSKITLNRIGVRSNIINDDMTTKGLNYRSSYDSFAGSTSVRATGEIFSGKYRLESNFYHNRNDAFLFGGASATYINNFTAKNGEKYWYELGRVKGRSDGEVSIGTNIFGAQIWNYDYDKISPKKLSGYVNPTSLVRVTINEAEPVVLSTYAGYYTLADMKMPEKVSQVKIEEIKEDGTVDIVKEEKYSLYGDRPFALESRASMYAGVWGYHNRLFREGANIYRGTNKKVTAGGIYQYGIRDNVTFESKITADNIYEKSASSVYYRIPTNDSLLVMGTQKNVNYLEGATTLNSVDYVSKKDPNLKLKASTGASIARDIRDEHTHIGYMGKGSAEYSKDLRKYAWKFIEPKNASAKVEGFHTSPDWYIASSDTTSKNDRTGGRVQGSLSFNNSNINGGYQKYYSNLNSRYDGGTIRFDQYNIGASTKVPKVATVRYARFFRRGSNDLGRNKNYNHELNISRDIGRWARIQAGRRESVYDTHYDNPNELNRNYKSKYGDTYIRTDIPLPQNKGRVMLGHSFVDYQASGYKNDYNMYRFGYTFPTWKRFTLGLGWGLRYHGQEGHDINATVGYRAKSGQMMTLGYQYSKNGGYFIDNMFLPTTNRHSVNFIFNDAYQLFQHGFKSIGDENADKGIFEAIVFIDTNKNGKYDNKIDIPVKDIPVATSWSNTPEYTNRSGRISASSVSSGVYKIGLDMNTLPITVAPLTNDLISKTVKIESGLTTKLELPLISTVGSVSGVLKIQDDFDRKLVITDFVVIIEDENGKEINYSTVNNSGEFYISGLAPGKYTLKLDDRYINAYALEKLQNLSERIIYIPFDYENPTDVVNQNLEYRTLSL